MLGRKPRGQMEMIFAGCIGAFVPENHILKRVDAVLDLSWLPAEVRHCYSHGSGRPGIDPEVAVRLMLAGLLSNMVHDRRLMREAQVNLAIRWFAGFGLNETLPDHSSLTRIRQRWGPDLFQRIFERSVEACVAAKLVGGDMLHVDATLIRADVSWSSLAREYVAAVDEANDDTSPTSKPAKGGFKKISRTDLDARMATNKYNQRLEPCYKQHTGVDAKYGVQVDAAISRADMHEGKALIGQVERVQALVGKKLSVVTADKGYASAANFAAVEARNLRAVIPPVRTRPAKVPLSRFKYDALHDVLRCPKARHLHRGTKTAKGALYRAKAADCRGIKGDYGLLRIYGLR